LANEDPTPQPEKYIQEVRAMTLSDQWLQFAPKPPELTGDQKWHVFLSYRSVHRPWVIQLYDVLRHLGFEVFLDQYVLAASSTLISGLADGLEKSASGILVWSTATQDSEWCKKECDAMESRATRNKNYHYVVVTLDKVELPFWASQRIYIDFSEYREGPRGLGLLKLLYGILGKPLPDGAVHLATKIDEDVQHALASVRAASKIGNCERLLELVKSDTPAWTTSALLGSQVAESLIKMKCYDDALTVLADFEKRFPKAIRTQQLKGLALAKKGDWKKAQIVLGELEAAGEQDPETLGIFARTWKDRYQESKDPKHLACSRDLYARAFKNAPGDYYTGINAASMSVLMGELPVAREYAEKVEQIVGNKKVDGDYWMTATVAEVQLIKQNYTKAAELYQAAVNMAPEEIGSHESTWVQAKRLMKILGPSQVDYDQVAKAFKHLPSSP
jgi:tetratricopeptide (TPR) repeat protein